MSDEPILHTNTGSDVAGAVPPPPPPTAATPPPRDGVEPHADTAGAASPGTDYSQFSVGDSLDGLVIHQILLQYPEAIVFLTREGNICFRESLGPAFDVALVEFYRLTSKSNARLKRAFGRQVNSLLGAALAEALSVGEEGDRKAAFAVVDAFIDENGPIKHVFGSSNDWVVFIDRDNELVCDCGPVTDAAAPLLTEFYRLRQLARASLYQDEAGALMHILGTELAISLQRTPPVDLADAFAASRDFIQLRNESRMRFRYVAASLASGVILGIVAWGVLKDDLGMLLGCVGGVIGAAISVLQRSADLEIRRFLPPLHVFMQGSVRVTLGMLFGLLLVAAARANLALGTFATSENALFLAGVAAGFSERFVPDLLTKIASESAKGSEAK